MAYSGIYTLKNPSKYYGDPNNVVYRSLWERYCFKYLDLEPSVAKWSSEEVIIRYFYEVDKKYHRYYPDLLITYKTGKTVLVEVKPKKETKPPVFKGRKTKRYITEGLTYVKNQNKWEAAKEYAADRGWQFEIWTEDLLEAKGIKPKSTKPLKPFKRRKKKR